MMHFINFKEYTPDVLGGVGDKSILWIKSENGNDWYECQHLFDSDTVKVMYDKSGVIRAAGFDVSAMFPIDMSVVEIESTDIPDIKILTDGSWMYNDGIKPIILTDAELVARAESKKAALMNEVNKTIAPLQDAVELNIASDNEKSLLLDWRKYRVQLNRLDVTTAPNIDWPEVPEHVA